MLGTPKSRRRKAPVLMLPTDVQGAYLKSRVKICLKFNITIFLWRIDTKLLVIFSYLFPGWQYWLMLFVKIYDMKNCKMTDHIIVRALTMLLLSKRMFLLLLNAKPGVQDSCRTGL